jgi:carbamoyltransferase
MKIMGLTAYYHDSAAALVVDGQVVAAAQEERFTRKKFDAAFPLQSLKFCLHKAGLKLSDLDEIVYYEKPFISFERLMESLIATAPRSLLNFLSAMPIWMREKLNTRGTLQAQLKKHFPHHKLPPISFSQHHLSHAASAFYPSPFPSAAVLCLDGVGEWACTSAWQGKGSEMTPLWEMHFPHSVGLLYSAFTAFCGFKVNSGEYKLMGLAPFGDPKYVDLILQKLMDLKDDGSFRLDMKYFAFASSPAMTTPQFAELFGVPPRKPEGPMPEVYKDLAASIQKVTEEILLRLVRTVKAQTGEKNLCLAGGVALNCVANGRIARQNIFEGLWIQPAAGDAGGALGAALASYHLHHKKPRKIQIPDAMGNALLGPAYSATEIEEALQRWNISYEILNDEALIHQAVGDLENQKVIGWFQGAMEYGPRSLGSRSILGDARNPQMQNRMNLKIKFRESFRPFAPVILAERRTQVYQEDHQSPYMLLVSHVQESQRSHYPAVTHVDGTARLQTVTPAGNPRLHRLLSEFETKTGAPLLINTSFNVRGEPIVCTPLDALRCFVKTDMDTLYLENFYVTKAGQNFNRQDPQWRTQLELD